jgi:hypothetical protein
LGKALGITRGETPGYAMRALAHVVITFVPLVGLAAWQGVLFGSAVTVPLVRDLGVYVRFLIAIPLFIFAERVVDDRLSYAVRTFRTSGLLEGRGRTDFEAALRRLERTRNSVLPEIVLLIVALGFGWLGNRAVLEMPVSGWRVTTPGLESSVTWAGAYFERVSLPVYQFLSFRWLWRVLVWSLFLGRVSRCDLKLVPTHPDGAAGLEFLGLAHTAFGAFLTPLAANAACQGVQWVRYFGGGTDAFRNALIAFAVVALAVALGPLLLFIPKLAAAKRAGLYAYGALASDYTRRFDEKWVRTPAAGDEPLLGTADIQSLADLSGSYEIVRTMRVVPLNTQHLISLLLAVALPMLPFIALIVPMKEILKQLAGLVMR